MKYQIFQGPPDPPYAHELAERLSRVDWRGNFDHTRSRVALMKEYLRRSALWAHHLNAKAWPFFDPAEIINPDVRASKETISMVTENEDLLQNFSLVKDTCIWALHFSALRDAGEELPDIPDMFSPLIIFYERGGGFGIDTTRLIQIDDAAMCRGSALQYREKEPQTSLDSATLDILDQ